MYQNWRNVRYYLQHYALGNILPSSFREVSTNDPLAAESKLPQQSLTPPPDLPKRTDRLIFYGRPVVYGWPSTGGKITKAVTAPEILHLGLDRFQESSRAEDPAEEDEFCRKLRNIGGKWVPDGFDHLSIIMGEAGEEEREKVNTRIETGWPSSGRGVWGLKFNAEKDERKLTKKLPMLELAMSMDERCEVLEKIGGMFYENPEDCEDLW
ncbi:hypothetical protein AJ80_07646 [Polytolypa hystricis UAMH7299]|uniref:Uncharacterized protein n=1 Tax=Polytolypa hystricis (strain UAMH7299) TaxID=1447883 RepID=A0A2B7XL70_POLH7|nr:hypothetical protein AJ80_07646 [Polytolypa hystricis UAMH7299]